eukprot:352346-Chlamydomonas_euryale.AAC.3
MEGALANPGRGTARRWRKGKGAAVGRRGGVRGAAAAELAWGPGRGARRPNPDTAAAAAARCRRRPWPGVGAGRGLVRAQAAP